MDAAPTGVRSVLRARAKSTVWLVGIGVQEPVSWFSFQPRKKAATSFRAHRQLLALPYVVMGYLAIFALAPLTAALGWTATLLVSLGGLQYSIGAFMYAFKHPQLWPATFGYHKAFHAATVLASLTFYW